LHGTVFGAVRIGLGCKQVQRLRFLSSSQPLPFVLRFRTATLPKGTPTNIIASGPGFARVALVQTKLQTHRLLLHLEPRRVTNLLGPSPLRAKVPTSSIHADHSVAVPLSTKMPLKSESMSCGYLRFDSESSAVA
jgi:hypothetical protein